MATANYDDTIIEALQKDPEFMQLYIEDTMNEQDEALFKIAIQHIIKAKGFNFDLVEKKKEAA